MAQNKTFIKNVLLPILLTGFSFAAAIVVGYVILNVTRNEPTSTVVELNEDEDEKDGEVGVSLKYAGYATLKNDEGIVELNFANPSKSKKSLSVDIVATIDGEDVTLASSDKIKPGYKIISVKKDPALDIGAGNYQGKFVVHFYNEEGREEKVNSEIAIRVYVK